MINFFIRIIYLLSFIICKSSYEDYTTIILQKIRIGSQSKEISLIMNTLSTKTILFTNSKKPYASEIQRGRKSDVLIDKIQFDGQKIQSFPFNLKIDNTKLNDQDIQGEIGLGVDKDNSTDFIDILYENQIIAHKAIGFEYKEKEDRFVFNLNPKVNDFKFSSLSQKKNFNSSDFYYESWISDISHILIGSTLDQLDWKNTITVKGEVAFDSRTKYIYIPKDYMKYISDSWKINASDCKLAHDLENDEKYYICSNDKKNQISEMPSLYFIIGGYGYRMQAKDLFEKDGNKNICLIRFYKDINNLWILGLPFLKEYQMVLDYDNARIGFNGGDILNFTNDYEKWINEDINIIVKLLKGYSDEKKIMIAGTIIGTIIILYVLFWLYRSCRRDKPKYHIELQDQFDKKEYYN